MHICNLKSNLATMCISTLQCVRVQSLAHRPWDPLLWNGLFRLFCDCLRLNSTIWWVCKSLKGTWRCHTCVVFWGGFDSLPTSLFCHRFDNMHWTESQQLLMEVQSVSRWTPVLWLTLPSSVICLLDGDFVRTILDALQTNRSQCYTAERNSVSHSASLSRSGHNLSYRPIRVQSNGHSAALSTLHSRLRASS